MLFRKQRQVNRICVELRYRQYKQIGARKTLATERLRDFCTNHGMVIFPSNARTIRTR
jgi:hypothetical protein